MIALRQHGAARMDLDRYREMLGPEADGLSDDELEVQLDADRALARAVCTAISTAGADLVRRVVS